MVETDKARNADEAIIAHQSHVLAGNRRKFQGAKVPGPIRSVERKFQGTKRLGSESSRERIGQGPIGTFAPGSELARERKGCESSYVYIREYGQHCTF